MHPARPAMLISLVFKSLPVPTYEGNIEGKSCQVHVVKSHMETDNLFVSMTFHKDQLFVITDHETLTIPQKLRGGLSWDRSYLLPLIQLTRTLELVYIPPIVGTSSIWHHKQVPHNLSHLKQLPCNQVLIRHQVTLEWDETLDSPEHQWMPLQLLH